jgi:hypothetical protein
MLYLGPAADLGLTDVRTRPSGNFVIGPSSRGGSFGYMGNIDIAELIIHVPYWLVQQGQ